MKEKRFKFYRRNIKSEIKEYDHVKDLKLQTQFERSSIISDEYHRNKTAYPATKMYPHGIPIPDVLAALNKEQIEKYDSLGKQIKSYIKSLNILRLVLINDNIERKKKLKKLRGDNSKKYSKSMIDREISKIRKEIDLIESWAFNNNEVLPEPIKNELDLKQKKRTKPKGCSKLSSERYKSIKRIYDGLSEKYPTMSKEKKCKRLAIRKYSGRYYKWEYIREIIDKEYYLKKIVEKE